MSTFFPFGQQSATSQPPVNYDIVLDKTYPRVGFYPTEQGGVYQEIVEVAGDLWFVTNATWDVNLQGFYQETGPLVNCNPANPAFAWVSRGVTGDSIRMYGAATGSSSTPVSWTNVFDVNANVTTVSPLPMTNGNNPGLQLNLNFDATTSTLLTGFYINTTLTAAAPLSSLEEFVVNGVPVWSVDTTGTLRVGIVNSNQLAPAVYQTLTPGTGIGTISAAPSATIQLAHGEYVDIGNSQTINGQKTINTLVPLIFGGAWGNIVGGSGDDYYLCSGCEIVALSPLTAKAKSDKSIIMVFKLPTAQQSGPLQMLTIYTDKGLTRGNTFSPGSTSISYLDVNGNLTLLQGGISAGDDSSVTGNFSVTGSATIGGKTTLNGTVVLGTNNTIQSLMNYFEANPNTQNFPGGAGLNISFDSSNSAIEFDTSALMLIGKGSGANGSGLTSADGSVKITKQSGTNQNVDLSVAESVAAGFQVYRGTNQSLTSPFAIIGSVNVTTSGNGGANQAPSGKVTVTFPGGLSFTNASYGLQVSIVQGDWGAVKAGNQTSGGFDVSVSGLTPGAAGSSYTVSYTCIGN